ncbi:hypothetical protein [Paenibacillus sp. FSL H7-0331]|uniref:hypothetical protein n=1 Tax=Paenibacillus sp. FSL H7-0331 TaxID=1920421 RepID=UPI00096CC79C|nr:hypothetical protein [Paenibacillus sp. FSL H7-0331]OMF00493.1 hypothetical protein BK127_38270 [Paenibacillus sp. FSL H7-0331]
MSDDLCLSDYKKKFLELLFEIPLYAKIKVNTTLKYKDEQEYLSDHEDDHPQIIVHTHFIENNDYILLKALVAKEMNNLYGYCPYCKRDMVLTSKGKNLEE